MTLSSLRLAPALSLLALLPAAADAQSAGRVLPGPLPDGMHVRDLQPARMIHATYDVESGRVTEVTDLVPGVEPLAGGTPCFDNSDLFCDMGPFEPYSIGNAPGEELLDWGVKDCNGTGMVQCLTIAYRTTAVDTSFGGPGAALSFGLYRNTRGFNRNGVQIFRQTFVGLPGVPPGTGTHDAAFVFLTIDFGTTPISLPDGPIGWGYLLLDNADPATATGALLVTAPNTATGVIDALDVFSPGPASTGTYTGTYNFSSVCNHPPCCPHASTYLQITEVPPGGLQYNGSGTNPMVLSEVLPPRLGQAWVSNIDLTGQPTGTDSLLWVSVASLATPIASPYGEILIDPAQRITPVFVSGSLHVIPVPNDPALNGLVLHTQGAMRSGGAFVLTNAVVTAVTY
jgi:hypothetical protein